MLTPGAIRAFRSTLPHGAPLWSLPWVDGPRPEGRISTVRLNAGEAAVVVAVIGWQVLVIGPAGAGWLDGRLIDDEEP